jgi:hypothetical protein
MSWNLWVEVYIIVYKKKINVVKLFLTIEGNTCQVTNDGSKILMVWFG